MMSENSGDGSSSGPVNEDGTWQVPEPGHSELVQMRIRLITLENLVIGLLSGASKEQIGQIEGLADAIEPRPGSTRHPLTELAANDMRKFLDRAQRLTDQSDHKIR